MIRHVVLMKFQERPDAAEAKRRLEALPGEIEEILSLEVVLDTLGTDVSYDLALVTTHESVASLKAYQVHPAHAVFGDWVRPRLTSRAVVDGEV